MEEPGAITDAGSSLNNKAKKRQVGFLLVSGVFSLILPSPGQGRADRAGVFSAEFSKAVGPGADVNVLAEPWQLLTSGTEEQGAQRGHGHRRDPRAALGCRSSSVREWKV